MTTTSVNHVAAATSITGNQVQIRGNTISAPYTAGNTSGTPISAIAFKLMVIGDVQGFVRIPFGDPDTLDGSLTPDDLKAAEISLTQGSASGSLELIAEELYAY